MIQRLAALYSIAWRAAIALLTIRIADTSLQRYVIGSEAPPPPIVANAFADPFLVVHVVASMAALLLVPLQFVPAIRNRRPDLHRLNGWICVAACAVGAPTGLVLCMGATAGPVAGLGFAVPAVLWPAFTWLGLRAVRERRLDDHRAWMLRAYAMLAGAITLRLLIPASAMLELDFFAAYRVNAWTSWIINLALAEGWIRRRRTTTKPAPLVSLPA